MNPPARFPGEDLRFWHALLALAILVAVVLRLSALSQESFWPDEAHSVLVAGFAEVSTDLRDLDPGPHPRLFFRLLAAWMKLFPIDEGGLRLLPALCGIAAVPALYALGRALLLPPSACVLGAFLFAINPHAIWYSQELRMYSLVGLLGLLHLAAGARLAHPRPGGRVSLYAPFLGWVASGAALLDTHFFAVFFFAVDAAGLAIVLRRSMSARPGSLRRLAARRPLLTHRAAIAFVGLAGALWIVTGGFALADVIRRAGTGEGVNWLGRIYHVTWGTPGEIFEGLIDGPQIGAAPTWLRVAAVAGFLVVVAFGVLAVPRARRGIPGVRTRRLWPAAVALLLIALPTLVSLWRVIILGGDRYLEIAVGPLCLAAGVGTFVAFHRGWRERTLAVAALILVVAAQAAYLSEYYRGREKRMFREAAVIMMASLGAGDAYLADDFSERLPIEFYSRGRVPLARAGIPVGGAVWSFSILRSPTPLEKRFVEAGWRPENTWEVEMSWPSTYVRLTRFVRQ